MAGPIYHHDPKSSSTTRLPAEFGPHPVHLRMVPELDHRGAPSTRIITSRPDASGKLHGAVLSDMTFKRPGWTSNWVPTAVFTFWKTAPPGWATVTPNWCDWSTWAVSCSRSPSRRSSS